MVIDLVSGLRNSQDIKGTVKSEQPIGTWYTH